MTSGPTGSDVLDSGVARRPSAPKKSRPRPCIDKCTPMATMNSVTDQEFQTSVLDSETPVLVDFWAEWCVPCHMVSPAVEEIGRQKGEKLRVAKLNIDENPDMTRRYGVMSIPTLMLFKDGKETARVVGARGKDALLKEIDPHVA